MHMPKMALFVGFIVSLVALAGCNVNTGDHWNGQKMVLASDLTPSDVAGTWEGSWESYDTVPYDYVNNGVIQFTLTPAEVAPVPTTLPGITSTPLPETKRYLAHVKLWHAQYLFLAPEEFNMIVTTMRGVNGQIQFHGERDLGPLYGTCRYDGFIDWSRASIAYVSRGDFGSVVIRRVVPMQVAASH